MPQKILFTASLIIFLSLVAYFVIALKPPDKLVSPAVGGKMAVNLWFPKAEANDLSSNLQISAKSAYFLDINTGRVLYQKNIHERLPIASLTKIMTAVVALENLHWDSMVVISERAAGMEPDSMLLKAGEKLTVEELLDGVFLVSGNDAAEALAETSVSSRDEFTSRSEGSEDRRSRFIDQMNKKTAQLGMNDTLFINPTGLEEDSREQYSTAYDVTLMSRYAIKNFPHLLDISSNPHIFLPATLTHQDYDLYSGINLLTSYPGVMGLKTGYTPEAGLTLVTLAQRDRHLVLGVLLNSENRREDAKELLDYSFKKLGVL